MKIEEERKFRKDDYDWKVLLIKSPSLFVGGMPSSHPAQGVPFVHCSALRRTLMIRVNGLTSTHFLTNRQPEVVLSDH